MSGYSDESAPISYTACDVEKPSGLVDLESGKFTVQRDGVYRLTFTARYAEIGWVCEEYPFNMSNYCAGCPP